MQRFNQTFEGDLQMKKIISSIVAALVAVSFAGIVCAAEPANTETKTESTTTNAAGAKVEKKEVKKKTLWETNLFTRVRLSRSRNEERGQTIYLKSKPRCLLSIWKERIQSAP